MSKQEERARKAAEWLEHLQSWKGSGQSLSAYAKTHGLALWAMYHWRSVLIREGRWHEQPKTADRSRAGRGSPVPLRFARVAITDSLRSMPLIVRVLLPNGRRAEMELSDAEHLADILSALERRT